MESVIWFYTTTGVKILVTGCIRSGTAYTTAVLRSLGLDVVHEGLGKDGSVSAFLGNPTATAEQLPPWHPPGAEHYDLVLHQVRHPVAVVGSMQTAGAHFWKFVRDVGGVPGSGDVRHAMAFWIAWNQRIEKQADARYRIEHVSWRQLCAWLPIQWNEHSADAIKKVPTDTNTRKERYRPLTWRILRMIDATLCAEIREMAIQYGYDV